MRKRYICLALAVLLCVMAIPFQSAFAEETEMGTFDIISLPYDKLNLARAIAVIEDGELSESFIGGIKGLSGKKTEPGGTVTIGETMYFSGLCEGELKDDLLFADEDTLFPLGEASSIFIWISIMQLYERGMLELNSDITGYLPDELNIDLSGGTTPVTIYHLMNGTVGWESCYRYQGYYDDITSDVEYDPDGNHNVIEYMNSIYPIQHFEAGKVRTSSGFEAAVAQVIIEQVSGTSYVEYVKNNILLPLEMEHTTLDAAALDRPELRESMADCFITSDSRYIAVFDEGYSTIPAINAAYSTLGDMTKLMSALTGDTAAIFKAEETYELFTSVSYDAGEDIPISAHGLPVMDGEELVLGFEVNSSFAKGEIAFSPVTKKAVIVLSNFNTSYSNSMTDTIHEHVFGKRVYEEQTEGLPKTSFLAGEYISAGGIYYGYMDLVNRFNMASMFVIAPYADFSTKKLYAYSEYQSLHQAYTTKLRFTELDQISPYTFIDNAGGIVRFMLDDEGNVEKIYYNGTEFVPMPWHRSIAITNITVILCYMIALFCVIGFFVMLGFMIYNRKNHIHNLGSSRLAPLLMLTLIAAVVNCMWLLFSSGGVLSYAACTIHFIINYVCSALMVAFSVGIIVLWRKSELFSYQKVGYIAIMAVSLILLVIMVFWNLYR
ncbi:MAG: beta-lactamase family protein [Clostridia bacterium]|nr:beta-lactamase family protein [Clostridia bacterium]